MGRILYWALIAAILPFAASGRDLRPAEEPPADFTARQYIDSRGCVFLRSDSGRWEARVARDGAPICGYPPSATIRGLGGKSRLRALDPDAGKSRAERMEAALATAIIPNLRPGELTSDPIAPEILPDMGPEPMGGEPLDALKASLRVAPELREAMAREIQPNRRLCRLLGYDATPGSGAGNDPTSGYCGAAPGASLSRLAFARPVEVAGGAGQVAVSQRRTVPAAVAAVSRDNSGTKGAARQRGGPIVEADMIPPSARYVRIGTFPAGEAVAAVVRRVAGLGYSVQRQKGGPVTQSTLLAGPFDTREAIVRALDRLRRNGFAAAVPR
ncbi:MAG TPA: SPOR domain-containing protein [Paracoccus sp. (in: a-proteobacteria)]|uniref:SPOR domain-containing protein n=1 Tax=Paracoccus sp. TaxID=267 RepID=UPI002C6463E9|nr:SPOR domain-containing protein [Paracoccus sp. (in: a-proteobacteria)]HWL56119.1 SPOR domain-containing protein [Paracoccus sp. (in: a-proteobacteria)]